MFYLFTIHLNLLSMAKCTQLLHGGIIKPCHHESAGLNKVLTKIMRGHFSRPRCKINRLMKNTQ